MLTRIALGYQRGVDRITEFAGTISWFLVLPLVFIGFANVVLRYVGAAVGQRLTTNALLEAQWYLYAVIFLLGFPYILKHHINVRVDFWYTNQTPRRKAWIDFLGHLIGLIPFSLLGIWVSWSATRTSWRINEQSPDPSGLPRAPIKTMVLVGFSLLFLQALAEMVKLVAILREHEELVEIPEEPEAPLPIE